MDIAGTVTALILLGATALAGIVTIVIALVRGDMKKFIIEQMEIAEQSGMSGKEKLQFVIDAVKSKYKILDIILNVKEFIEKIISISKNINAK